MVGVHGMRARATAGGADTRTSGGATPTLSPAAYPLVDYK